MNVLIAGGSGFVGQAFIKAYGEKHNITVLSRNPKKAQAPCAHSDVTWLSWQELEQKSSPLAAFDAVVNCCGESVAGGRFNAAFKKKLWQSRIDPTKKLAALMHSAPKHLVWVQLSGVGIYGGFEDTKQVITKPLGLDEITRDHSFMQDLGLEWEKTAQEAFKLSAVRGVLFRLGVVLDPDGGALVPLKRAAKCNLLGPMGSGEQPFSWVAVEDVVDALNFALENSALKGTYNLVAPEVCTQKAFAKALAQACGRWTFLPTPALVLKVLLGEMAKALILKGQAVLDTHLSKQGFTFRYTRCRDWFDDKL